MNILFHSAVSVAIASFTFKKLEIKSSSIILLIILGITSHGVLDILPHTYPIKSVYDILLSCSLIFTAFMLSSQKKIIVISFLACIAPDLIDLGPRIIAKFLGNLYPIPLIFPWHYTLSGSIYQNEPWISFFCHFFVIILSCFIFIWNVKNYNKKRNKS